MSQNIQMLIIDPQNDFCDLPEAYRPLDPTTGTRLAPALPVRGAHADMQRLAHLLREGARGLNEITVTLDSHHRLDIAHPTFWRTADGSPVPAFTPIVAAQVRAGALQPRSPQWRSRVLADLDELEARGRHTLMVWPVHCEIGSWGHNVHADVRAAYNLWEEQQLETVQKVMKGHNPWTEHYSAVLAEVPDAEDPDTLVNRALIRRLDRADLLLVAGEASSHCVRATVLDIAQYLPGKRLDRLVLLTDCMSPVAGFETQHEEFLAAFKARGGHLAASVDVLPRLRANAAR